MLEFVVVRELAATDGEMFKMINLFLFHRITIKRRFFAKEIFFIKSFIS